MDLVKKKKAENKEQNIKQITIVYSTAILTLWKALTKNMDIIKDIDEKNERIEKKEKKKQKDDDDDNYDKKEIHMIMDKFIEMAKTYDNERVKKKYKSIEELKKNQTVIVEKLKKLARDMKDDIQNVLLPRIVNASKEINYNPDEIIAKMNTFIQSDKSKDINNNIKELKKEIKLLDDNYIKSKSLKEQSIKQKNREIEKMIESLSSLTFKTDEDQRQQRTTAQLDSLRKEKTDNEIKIQGEIDIIKDNYDKTREEYNSELSRERAKLNNLDEEKKEKLKNFNELSRFLKDDNKDTLSDSQKKSIIETIVPDAELYSELDKLIKKKENKLALDNIKINLNTFIANSINPILSYTENNNIEHKYNIIHKVDDVCESDIQEYCCEDTKDTCNTVQRFLIPLTAPRTSSDTISNYYEFIKAITSEDPGNINNYEEDNETYNYVSKYGDFIKLLNSTQNTNCGQIEELYKALINDQGSNPSKLSESIKSMDYDSFITDKKKVIRLETNKMKEYKINVEQYIDDKLEKFKIDTFGKYNLEFNIIPLDLNLNVNYGDPPSDKSTKIKIPLLNLNELKFDESLYFDKGKLTNKKVGEKEEAAAEPAAKEEAAKEEAEKEEKDKTVTQLSFDRFELSKDVSSNSILTDEIEKLNNKIPKESKDLKAFKTALEELYKTKKFTLKIKDTPISVNSSRSTGQIIKDLKEQIFNNNDDTTKNLFERGDIIGNGINLIRKNNSVVNFEMIEMGINESGLVDCTFETKAADKSNQIESSADIVFLKNEKKKLEKPINNLYDKVVKLYNSLNVYNNIVSYPVINNYNYLFSDLQNYDIFSELEIESIIFRKYLKKKPFSIDNLIDLKNKEKFEIIKRSHILFVNMLYLECQKYSTRITKDTLLKNNKDYKVYEKNIKDTIVLIFKINSKISRLLQDQKHRNNYINFIQIQIRYLQLHIDKFILKDRKNTLNILNDLTNSEVYNNFMTSRKDNYNLVGNEYIRYYYDLQEILSYEIDQLSGTPNDLIKFLYGVLNTLPSSRLSRSQASDEYRSYKTELDNIKQKIMNDLETLLKDNTDKNITDVERFKRILFNNINEEINKGIKELKLINKQEINPIFLNGIDPDLRAIKIIDSENENENKINNLFEKYKKTYDKMIDAQNELLNSEYTHPLTKRRISNMLKLFQLIDEPVNRIQDILASRESRLTSDISMIKAFDEYFKENDYDIIFELKKKISKELSKNFYAKDNLYRLKLQVIMTLKDNSEFKEELKSYYNIYEKFQISEIKNYLFIVSEIKMLEEQIEEKKLNIETIKQQYGKIDGLLPPNLDDSTFNDFIKYSEKVDKEQFNQLIIKVIMKYIIQELNHNSSEDKVKIAIKLIGIISEQVKDFSQLTNITKSLEVKEKYKKADFEKYLKNLSLNEDKLSDLCKEHFDNYLNSLKDVKYEYFKNITDIFEKYRLLKEYLSLTKDKEKSEEDLKSKKNKQTTEEGKYSSFKDIPGRLDDLEEKFKKYDDEHPKYKDLLGITIKFTNIKKELGNDNKYFFIHEFIMKTLDEYIKFKKDIEKKREDDNNEKERLLIRSYKVKKGDKVTKDINKFLKNLDQFTQQLYLVKEEDELKGGSSIKTTDDLIDANRFFQLMFIYYKLRRNLIYIQEDTLNKYNDDAELSKYYKRKSIKFITQTEELLKKTLRPIDLYLNRKKDIQDYIKECFSENGTASDNSKEDFNDLIKDYIKVLKISRNFEFEIPKQQNITTEIQIEENKGLDLGVYVGSEADGNIRYGRINDILLGNTHIKTFDNTIPTVKIIIYYGQRLSYMNDSWTKKYYIDNSWEDTVPDPKDTDFIIRDGMNFEKSHHIYYKTNDDSQVIYNLKPIPTLKSENQYLKYLQSKDAETIHSNLKKDFKILEGSDDDTFKKYYSINQNIETYKEKNFDKSFFNNIIDLGVFKENFTKIEDLKLNTSNVDDIYKTKALIINSYNIYKNRIENLKTSLNRAIEDIEIIKDKFILNNFMVPMQETDNIEYIYKFLNFLGIELKSNFKFFTAKAFNLDSSIKMYSRYDSKENIRESEISKAYKENIYPYKIKMMLDAIDRSTDKSISKNIKKYILDKLKISISTENREPINLNNSDLNIYFGSMFNVNKDASKVLEMPNVPKDTSRNEVLEDKKKELEEKEKELEDKKNALSQNTVAAGSDTQGGSNSSKDSKIGGNNINKMTKELKELKKLKNKYKKFK